MQTRISSLLGGILSAGWRPRQESNLYLALRRRSFYPLNYGGGEWILEAGQITAEVVLSERAQVIACTKALQRHFSLQANNPCSWHSRLVKLADGLVNNNRADVGSVS